MWKWQDCVFASCLERHSHKSLQIACVWQWWENDWQRQKEMKGEKKVPPRFELGLQDSESWVLTNYTMGPPVRAPSFGYIRHRTEYHEEQLVRMWIDSYEWVRNMERVKLDVSRSSQSFPFVSEFDEDCISADCSCSLRSPGREVCHGFRNGRWLVELLYY